MNTQIGAEPLSNHPSIDDCIAINQPGIPFSKKTWIKLLYLQAGLEKDAILDLKSSIQLCRKRHTNIHMQDAILKRFRQAACSLQFRKIRTRVSPCPGHFNRPGTTRREGPGEGEVNVAALQMEGLELYPLRPGNNSRIHSVNKDNGLIIGGITDISGFQIVNLEGKRQLQLGKRECSIAFLFFL